MDNIKKYFKIIVSILILLLVFIMIMLMLETRKREKYIEQVSLGDKYLAQQQYDNAELCYKRALSIHDKEAKPYIGLADTFIQQGEYKEASNILTEGNKAMKSAKQKQKMEKYIRELRDDGVGVILVKRNEEDGEFDDPVKGNENGTGVEIDDSQKGGEDEKESDYDSEVPGEGENDNEEVPEVGPEEGSGEGETGELDPLNVEEENNGQKDEFQNDPGRQTPQSNESLSARIEKALGMPYIGSKTYIPKISYSGKESVVTSIGECGFLGALQRDFDRDGVQEVLVVGLRNDLNSFMGKDCICMYMLEEKEGILTLADTYTASSPVTENEKRVFTMLATAAFPANVRFCVTETPDSSSIYMEYVQNSGLLIQESFAGTQRYVYQNNQFMKLEEGTWGDQTQVEHGSPFVTMVKKGLLSNNFTGPSDEVPICCSCGIYFVNTSDVSVPALESGSVDLLEISLGMSEQDFRKQYDTILGQQISGETYTGDDDAEYISYCYQIENECHFKGVPLPMEFVFRNGILSCFGFYIQGATEYFGSYEAQNKYCDDFLGACLKKMDKEPEILSFEGTEYRWDIPNNYIDYIVQPGIVQFRKADTR